MFKIWPKFLILLLIGALIVCPPLILGYIDLARAQHASDQIEASHLYEDAARLLFWRTDLYERAGLTSVSIDPQRAIQMLNLARQKNALTSSGEIALGDAYLADGEPDKAISEWEDLFNRKQETGRLGPRLAREYHGQGQYNIETRVLRQWLEIDPLNAEANERLGILLTVSAAPEALSFLNRASAASPEAASRLDGLITALKTSAKDPAYRLALCGQILARMNEWRLAQQAFSNAVEANPQYAAAWAWLGLTRQQNKAAGALEALEYAVKLDKKSAPLHAMLGTYWMKADDSQKARAEFDLATQLEPSNPVWWRALASAAAQTDLATALNAYVLATSLAPQEAENWYALAAFCVENNAYLEEYGLNAALRAYALAPKNPAYIDMLGRAQMGLGQTDAAEAMFKQALETDGQENPFIYHFHLGLLYLQTQRQTEARKEFQTTVELNPQGPYGKQAKALLERYFP
jgi:tetratricopeptide (TPR) repeat protein